MKTQGEKIYLKGNLSEESYPLLLEWFTDLEVIGYLYSAKRIVEFQTIDDVREFPSEDQDELFWEIYTHDDKFIGYTSLCNFSGKEQCEFSIFILDKNFWGKGIGREVIGMMLEYAFDELEMQAVILETSEFHYGAIKLYKKCGFRKVEVVPNHRAVFHEGNWMRSGSVIMALDRDYFLRTNH